jgi:N-methylhydantoinase B
MVRAALKGLLAPTDAANEGHFLLPDFDDEPGLVVSAERPAPVDSYGYVCVALCELTIRALAAAIPERCPAGGGQLFGAFMFRVDPRDGAPFIFIEPMDVGNGARPDDDGPTLMFLGNGDVLNTPVEVVEARYPIRVERFELRPESAGAGALRGGMGVRRDYRILEGGTLMQCANENTRRPLARGLDGGEDGRPNVIVVAPGTGREDVVSERASFYGPFPVGELVSVRSGGGGGRGRPAQRAAGRVDTDVRDGLVSIEAARDVYRVAVAADGIGWSVDEAATRALRAEVA